MRTMGRREAPCLPNGTPDPVWRLLDVLEGAVVCAMLFAVLPVPLLLGYLEVSSVWWLLLPTGIFFGASGFSIFLIDPAKREWRHQYDRRAAP